MNNNLGKPLKLEISSLKNIRKKRETMPNFQITKKYHKKRETMPNFQQKTAVNYGWVAAAA